MPRPLLALILFVTLSVGSAQDAAEPVDAPTPFGVTVTCSARLPAAVVGCMAERRVLVLGGFELAIGIDAQAALTSDYSGHLAPYAVLAYYGEALSAWVELRLPELAGLHPLGDPDYLRVGFSYRFN